VSAPPLGGETSSMPVTVATPAPIAAGTENVPVTPTPVTKLDVPPLPVLVMTYSSIAVSNAVSAWAADASTAM
jgi:hypothetical protein